MKALGTHRSNFTWARKNYNQTDDPAAQIKYAKYMGKYLAEGLADGFTVEQITYGRTYPAEVDKYAAGTDTESLPSVSDEQANKEIAASVDIADVLRLGEGGASVYAYGYRCCPDRPKIGYATGDVIQRITDQIYTSTPDKPVLYLEIKAHDCRTLERALHSVLQIRGRKVVGGGDEWFKVTRDELLSIYKFIQQM